MIRMIFYENRTEFSKKKLDIARISPIIFVTNKPLHSLLIMPWNQEIDSDFRIDSIKWGADATSHDSVLNLTL